MSLNVYVSKVAGEKQGKFGPVRSPAVGANESITIGSARTESAVAVKPAPVDSFEAAGSQSPASGQATGKRQHKPFCLSGYY